MVSIFPIYNKIILKIMLNYVGSCNNLTLPFAIILFIAYRCSWFLASSASASVEYTFNIYGIIIRFLLSSDSFFKR